VESGANGRSRYPNARRSSSASGSSARSRSRSSQLAHPQIGYEEHLDGFGGVVALDASTSERVAHGTAEKVRVDRRVAGIGDTPAEWPRRRTHAE